MSRFLAVFVMITLTVLPMAARAAESGSLEEANKFFARGNKFVEGNSLQRAKQEYQKALKIYPQHLDALYNLGVVCERLGQKSEAIEQYKRYLAIKPKDNRI